MSDKDSGTMEVELRVSFGLFQLLILAGFIALVLD